MSLRGAAAITGVAELPPSKEPPPAAELDLLGDLVAAALDDAGLSHDDVDGLFAVPPRREMFFPSLLSEHLGLRPRFGDVVDLGGASAAAMVWRAAAAIASGMCQVVVCAMASVMDPARFARAAAGGSGRRAPLGLSEYEAPFGPMGVNTAYALAARRHMHEFGTTSEQLAKIAVDQRTNALANPQALYGHQPLTIDDVLSSRLIVDPLHLLEIVRPCSGGAAWVIAAPDIAAAGPKPPAWLLGAGERIGHNAASFAPSLTTTPVAESAPAAFAMAGVGPSDVDLVSVYDCYTIMVLLTLEDAGFCPKGDGGRFVEERDLTFRGDLPVNTHGGQLSFGQPGIAGGASHIIEAVRQLRGEAGERQLARCDLAFVNGNGGTMSEEVSLVLGGAR